MIQVGQLIQTSNLISQTQFISMMFNGLQCSQVKKVCSKLHISLVLEKFDVKMKSLHRQNSLACGPLYLNSRVNPKDMTDLID